MSLLFPSRRIVQEVLVPASPARVLAFLHDVPAFIRLNPLVIGVEASPDEASTYLIVDRLVVLGLPFEQRYQARITQVADGLDSEVWASLGVRLHNELRVTPEGAGARVRETVDLTAPRLLSWYACSAARAAHRELLDRLSRAVEPGT